MNKSISSKKIDPYLLFSAIVVLFTSWTVYYKLPYIFWFIQCFSIWTFVKYHELISLRINAVISFFIISIWFYIPFNFTIPNLLVSLLSALSLTLILCIDKKTTLRIVDCIFTIVAGLVVIGLVFHVLRFFNIYDSPRISIIEPQEGRIYAVYLFHVYEELPNKDFLLFRFYSIFDEPGYLGTITAFYLIHQDCNFKKNKNKILFVGGVLTLSLAFYFLVVPYLMLKLSKRANAMTAFAIAIGIFIVANVADTDGNLFLARSEFSSDEFSSSRGNLDIIEENTKFILNQDYLSILFGNGYDSHFYVNQMRVDEGAGITNSSIFRLLYQIGFLGVIYLVAFVFLNIKHDRKSLYFGVAFAISLIQRPQVFELIFVFLLATNFKSVLDDSSREINKRYS